MRSNSATILAIDTSTHSIGIALLDNAQVYCEHSWQSPDYHTVELAPMVEQAIRRSSITKENIAAISVAIGPGSFTGLRIGLALAKGMALAMHIPLIGIPTLDILAAGQPKQETPALCLLRAGRGRLVIREYVIKEQDWVAINDYKVLTPQELTQQIQEPTWVCGELYSEERAFLAENSLIKLASPVQCVRRPAQLAELGWKRWQKGLFDEVMSLTPIYIHYNEPISS
ncbi:MAG: tRNA (adenosine(37)-N6)-threonylcarbamoyltransferase complex dimerization subunit type 1 TsaB [Anaerolineales bacterium]